MVPLLIALAAVAAAYQYRRMADKGLDVWGDPQKGVGGTKAPDHTGYSETKTTDAHADVAANANTEILRLREENARLQSERDAKVRDREESSRMVASLQEQLRVALAQGDTRARDLQAQLDEARRTFQESMDAANTAKEKLVQNANAAARAAEDRANAQAALLPRRAVLTVERNGLLAALDTLTAQITSKAQERMAMARGISGYEELLGFRITGDDFLGTERVSTSARVVVSGSVEALRVDGARAFARMNGNTADPYPEVRIVSDGVWQSMGRMMELTEQIRVLLPQRDLAKVRLDAVMSELETINDTLNGNKHGLVRTAKMALVSFKA